MAASAPGCLTCGAYCFGHDHRYIAILPEDAGRPIPRKALTEVDGRFYMTMKDGHCAQLLRNDNRLSCAIYDVRPEACRGMRAGSFECGKARQCQRPLAEAYSRGK